MDKEQIIALAEKAKLFVVRNGDCDVEDLLRFLEAYKAELLKEVQGRCDGLEKKLAKAEQRVAEACSAYMLNKNYNSLEFDRKYSAKEFCAGQKSTVEFLAKMIRSGEWRKFVKEV